MEAVNTKEAKFELNSFVTELPELFCFNSVTLTLIADDLSCATQCATSSGN